ncbi:hypothetical protein [Streptococcus ruminantium]|uniref:hypothetical protein n=1 Tax=Streptococcus ruminantium TaxID=1917441 RepID=UPI001F18E209|nr:hypothetical protein [Streptococcus ruminantium]BDD40528.1 hypothetical protein GUT184_07920 [Streptococcus ruminantium]
MIINSKEPDPKLRWDSISKVIRQKLARYAEENPTAVKCKLVCFDRKETYRKVLFGTDVNFDKLFWIESADKAISKWSYGYEIDLENVDTINSEFILDVYFG